MKRTTTVLLLALLALGATFYADDGLDHDGQHFNVTVGADQESAVLIGEYYSAVLRLDDCTDKDIYVFCLENLSKDIVEHYPHEYQLTVSISQPCKDCSPYGESCEEDLDCGKYCVHEVCRPRDPWCGDGFCDAGESCERDCAAEDNETINESSDEENETSPEADEAAGGNETGENETGDALAAQNRTAPSPNASTNTSSDEPAQESALKATSAPASEDDANWAAGIAIVVLGVAALVFVFRRHND